MSSFGIWNDSQAIRDAAEYGLVAACHLRTLTWQFLAKDIFVLQRRIGHAFVMGAGG
ncbi:MAG: hypothetical protein ACRD8U_23225 [Pyrinomonadaceae bacterium]